MLSLRFFKWFLALAIVLPSAAHARDLVILEAQGVGNYRDSGNSVPDLLESFLDQTGAFSGLSGEAAYSMSLDYLGIANFIEADANAFGATVTVSFPLTGFSRTFVAANADQAEDEIENYFEEGAGTRELAKLVKASNSRTPLAVLDGNPRSTTALLARGAFERFGLGAPRSRAGVAEATLAEWGHFDLSFRAAGGAVDVDDFDSLYAGDVAFTLGGDFEPGLGIYLTTLGGYRRYDDAEVFDFGFELGVPISLVRPGGGGAFHWNLTPVAQFGIGASLDLAAGGTFVGGGAVNSMSLHQGPLEFTLANALLYYRGIPTGQLGDVNLRTKLDQLITRNGAKLTLRPESLVGVFVEAGASLTTFLTSTAAVESYVTPAAGVGIQLADTLQLKVGWESDLGSDYAAHIGKGEIALEF